MYGFGGSFWVISLTRNKTVFRYWPFRKIFPFLFYLMVYLYVQCSIQGDWKNDNNIMLFEKSQLASVLKYTPFLARLIEQKQFQKSHFISFWWKAPKIFFYNQGLPYPPHLYWSDFEKCRQQIRFLF